MKDKCKKRSIAIAKDILNNDVFHEFLCVWEGNTFPTTLQCYKCLGEGNYRINLFGLGTACYICNETGYFNKPDIYEIVSKITCSQGKNKGKIREAYTGDKDEGYFVWRYARYYAKLDKFKPVLADKELAFNPWSDYLKVFAEYYSKYLLSLEKSQKDQ